MMKLNFSLIFEKVQAFSWMFRNSLDFLNFLENTTLEVCLIV